MQETTGATPLPLNDQHRPGDHAYGTEAQKHQLLPAWCAPTTSEAKLSEPEAGSDLASLRTRAVRDGDDFVVNARRLDVLGQRADEVRYVRTDPEAPAQGHLA